MAWRTREAAWHTPGVRRNPRGDLALGDEGYYGQVIGFSILLSLP